MNYKHAHPGSDWAIAIAGGAYIMLLLGTSAGAAAAGRQSYVTPVLAAAVTVDALWRILRRFREAGKVPAAAAFPAGVPIRPGRGRLVATGAVLAMVGVAALASGPPLAPLLRAASWACLASGAAMSVAAAARVLPREHVEFRDDVLVLGMPGYTVAIPWHRIRALEGSTYIGNHGVYFWFDAPEAFAVMPPVRQDRFLRRVQACRKARFIPADFYLRMSAADIDIPDLVVAMTRRCGPLAPPDAMISERAAQRV